MTSIFLSLATCSFVYSAAFFFAASCFLDGFVGGGKLQSAGHGRVAAMVVTIPALLLASGDLPVQVGWQ